MPAVRQHPQHLAVLVVAQADGADGVGVRPVLGPAGERELGVRVDHRLVQPLHPSAAAAALVVVVLGDEDDPRDDDAACGMDGNRRSMVRPPEQPPAAAAEVGREENRGQQHEQAESYGDCVAETYALRALEHVPTTSSSSAVAASAGHGRGAGSIVETKAEV